MKNKLNLSSTENYKTICKYILFFVLFFILEKAGINGKTYGFAFGLFFALVWCNQNILILSPLYVGSCLLANFGLNTAIASVSCVLVLLICYGIHYKFKKPIKPWLFVVYAIISQAPNVFFQIYSGANIIVTAVSLILALLFMISTMNFLSAVFLRGITKRLSPLEILCGAIIIIGFSSGISSLEFYNFEFIKLIASFLILATSYCFNFTISLSFSGLLGIGSMLYTNNPVYIAPFILWAFAVGIFKSKTRIFSLIGLMATELAIGYALSLYYSYSYMEILPVAIGCLIFIAIPSKWLMSVAPMFELSKDKLAMRNIVNRSRETLSKRLGDLSEVFGEMDRVFRGMIKGAMSKEEAKVMLVNEVREKVCNNCKEKNRCHRTFGEETESIFGDLIMSSLERGKATLLDIPPYLTARCNNLNMLVSTVNTLSSQYKKYAGMMNNVDASKILIAEQLGGISKVMKSLSSEVNKNVSFDTVREEELINELAYYNIVCGDAVIYEQNTDLISVTLLLRDLDTDDDRIAKIVSKVLSTKMQISDVQNSQTAGMNLVTLKTSSAYDIIFGTASEKKTTSRVSGDCYSLIRICSDKFLVALCDGMGSGEKAQKTSNLAISLIENFYKAGFDNDTILSSVNKLLSIASDEMFSTLDLCVLDLRKATGDFIKLGAPSTYIKHSETTEIISNNALPLGIVQEMKPVVKKIILNNLDMIVLCTDGIFEAFKEEEILSHFINNELSLNPQILAERILEKAKENFGEVGYADDMTVVVAKIFEK